jgi:hypothetical protein
MNQMVLGMYMGDYSHIDTPQMGRSVMEWYARSLEEGLAARDKLPPALFLDCSQQEFAQRPMELVERLCREFNLPLSQEGRAAMQAHVDANPKGKHGRHEYDLATYGLTRELIDQRFSFYTDDGRWPISE